MWLERSGGVRRLRRAGRSLRPGDRLHLYYDPRILAASPPAAALIADEGEYSVWYKPPGMYSQGSRWGDHCSIGRWAEKQLQRNAFVVHRLDRAASGLMLIAHHKTAARRLAALFQQRKLEKYYRVWAHGHFPAAGRVLDWPVEGREARSRVRRLLFDETRQRSLLEVRIETGRKHQIRRHLAQAGHLVVGDRLYGRTTDPEDLQLQAWRLAFVSPFDERQVSYQLPDEFQLQP